jgi:hypothetical protein
MGKRDKEIVQNCIAPAFFTGRISHIPWAQRRNGNNSSLVTTPVVSAFGCGKYLVKSVQKTTGVETLFGTSDLDGCDHV